MLGKLIKYEFKASGRILIPLYLAMIAAGFITALFFKLPSGAIDNSFFGIFAIIMIVMYILLMFASFILSFVIAIFRFKKNLFDTEGYLMNTLPVSSYDNISSKLIVAVVYQILSFIAAAISGLLYAVLVYKGETFNLSYLFNQAAMFIDEMGGMFYVYALEFFVLSILALISSNLSIYSAISIGHSANSNKVLKSVLAFIGLYIIAQIINVNVLNILSKTNSMLVVEYDPLKGENSIAQPVLITTMVLEFFYCVVYFAISNYFLKNKLNLQ